MKALVTGASGFIGSHLCEELIRQGYNVSCLTRGITSNTWIGNLNVRQIKGNCTIGESLLDLPDDFDYIFHLAGLTKACSPDDFFSVNARGTEILVKTVAERNPSVKRFIYVSSLAAVGPSRDGHPVREDTPPSPVSNYGKSKLEGEHAVLRYRDIIPVTILRPPAVYGPRDRDMLVMFQMVKKGFFFDLGKCYYSVLYVNDLVQGILLSAGKMEAIGKIYCLSDGDVHSGGEIIREISSALQVRPRPIKVPKFAMPFFAAISERINKQGIINRDRVEDFRHSHWICDAGKAREEIEFSPKVSMKEGIRWTADWYRMHKWL
jgi:nucleoside-diphosphate-sugar epimerase